MKVRKRSLIIIGLILFAVVFWVGAHQIICWEAPAYINRFVKQQSGLDFNEIKTMKVRTNYFGTFYIDTNMGTVAVRTSINPLSKGFAWRVDVEAPEIKTEELAKLLRDQAPQLKNLRGTMSMNVEAIGRLYPTVTFHGWKADVSGKRMVWSRDNGLSSIPFSADVRLDKDKIDIISATVRSNVHIKGEIKTPFKEPDVNLLVRAEEASIPKLIEMVSSERRNELYGGTVSFIAQVKGTVSNPTVRGSGTVNASYANIQFPESEGSFEYVDRHASATADIAGAQVTMKGTFAQNEPSRWDMTMKGVSLESIALANGWQNVKGTMDAHLNVEMFKDVPEIDGDMNVDGFHWGRYKADEPIVGKVAIDANKVQVLADPFVLKASIKNSIAKIQEFRLPFAKDSRLAASGTVNLQQKEMDLTIKGKKVPPDLWPPLVARYPQISGSMDLDGTVKGSWAAPIIDADVSFSNLKFLPSGGSWNGKADVKGSAEQMGLQNVRIEGGYAGEVVWSASKKGALQVRASLDQASPQLFFDIFKSTALNAGLLSGQAFAEFRDGFPFGVSTISWSNGQVGTFVFDDISANASFNGKKIEIEKFSLRQDARAVQGSGTAAFENSGWTYRAAVQLQHWGNNAFFIDGEAQANGRLTLPEMNIRTTVQSPLMWVNDVSFENLTTQIERTNGQWVARGGAGDNMKFNASFNENSRRLLASLDGKNIKLEEYFSKSIPSAKEIPKGEVSVQARVKGILPANAAPVLKSTIDVSSQKIAWRKEILGGKASLDINSSTITISQASLHLEKGGDLAISGMIPLSAASTYQLSGKGNDLSLQSVFHLLEFPVRAEGVVDTDFKVGGAANARETSAAFHGSHNGFGPFSDPGAFHGKVVERNGEWDFSGVRVESGGGYLALLPGSKIFIDRNGTSTMQFFADSRNLRAGLLTFFGGAEVTGSWKKTAGFEIGEKPTSDIEMDVFARSLWVNHFVLDGNVTHLTLRSDEVEFSQIPGSGQQLSGILIHKDYPMLEVKNFRVMDGSLEKCFVNGFVGPNKWDFDLRLKEVDAGILRNLFDANFPIEGLMDAKIKGTGDLKDPQLVGELVLENGHLDMLPIDSAKAKLDYSKEIITIKDFEAFKKKGYQMIGWIRFPTHEEGNKVSDMEMDLTIDKGDFAFLHDMWPQIVTKGKGTFNGRFRMANKSWGPSVSGYFNAQKVLVHSIYTPDLEKGQFKIRLDKNRLNVEDAQAMLGEGKLVLSGYIDFKNGLPDFYNLSLRTENNKGINLRVPQLSISPGPFLGQFGILKKRLAGASKGEPLVNLILKGPAEEPLLAGTIEMENTVFTYPPTATAAGISQNSPLSRFMREFKNSLKMDVSLIAGSRTWYQNELVDAAIGGSMNFVGPMSDLDINGKINTTQGSIVYSGSEFKIKDATLELQTRAPALGNQDDKKINVYLKATAEKDVFYTDGLSNNNQDTIVMVVDRSLIGEIQPRFYSRYNPSLSSQRALQLALGLPLSESVDTNNLLPDQRASHQNDKEANDKLLRLGLVQLLDASLASPLARALARNTGLVDTIRISYEDKDPLADNEVAVGNQTSNNITQNEFLKYAKGTKVKFGRGLSSRLFADYSVRVDEYQNQVDLRHEVELSYQLKRNLYLRGISELDNEQQLGRVPDRRAILENQWRFGLPKPKPMGPKVPRES